MAENILVAWRTRRLKRRTEIEARHLVGEARRILRRNREKIPESVTADINASIAAVESAMAGSELHPLRQAMAALDAKMDSHLQFGRKSTFREYFESIGVAVAIALLLRAFVVEAFQIPSGSMIPTLEIGDHIFVSKFAYGITIPFTNKKMLEYAEPKRGDVIVFKYPLGPETDYIKRVVALPGDKVEMRRNEVFINGRPVPREHSEGGCRYSEGPVSEKECELWVETLDANTHKVIHEPGRPGVDYGPSVVPPKHVFVMGDNRDNSNDSRVWGTVPYELVKGRALIVWWSRGPTRGEWTGDGIAEWFGAIRWRRFFQLVE